MGGGDFIKGPRDREGNPVGEKTIPAGTNQNLGNWLLSAAVDRKTDLESGVIKPPADGSPYKDTRPGKGPTNPATGNRDPSKKGVVNPFGDPKPTSTSTGLTAEDAAFKSAQLSEPQPLLEPQPFVSSNAEPAEGINNRIFDDVRTLDEEDIDTGEPSDAEIAQFSGGLASDDDGKVGQI